MGKGLVKVRISVWVGVRDLEGWGKGMGWVLS